MYPDANTMADTTSSNPSGGEEPLLDGSTEGDLQTPVTSSSNVPSGDDAIPHRYTIPSADAAAGRATNESVLGNTNYNSSKYDGGADESAGSRAGEGMSATPFHTQTISTEAAEPPKIGSSPWFETAVPSSTSRGAAAPSRNEPINATRAGNGEDGSVANTSAPGPVGGYSAASNDVPANHASETTGSSANKQSSKDAAGLSSETPEKVRSMEHPNAIPTAGGQALGTAAGEDRKQAKAEGRDYDAELADTGSSSGGDGTYTNISNILNASPKKASVQPEDVEAASYTSKSNTATGYWSPASGYTGLTP